MSDVLARIRVRETHGIRRFLYPLTTYMTFSSELDLSMLDLLKQDNTIDLTRLCLVTSDHQTIPVQITHVSRDWARVDFAVSVSPYEDQDYLLMVGMPRIVDDPLQINLNEGKILLRSRQLRFEVASLHNGCIAEVIYNGIRHLRGPLNITRKGRLVDEELSRNDIIAPVQSTLAAWSGSWVRYLYDDHSALTNITLTACKSWATVTHRLHKPKQDDKVTFTLPFAVTASILTCDFGVGGGTFGKLQAEAAEEIVWKTVFSEEPYAQWSLATAGRVDYIGKVATAEEFLPQRWFHLIDSDKALAVAITELPESCREMTVSLNIQGDVVIDFRLGEQVPESVTSGVCYHFLNDVPAIAAATNPQSILLPPTVEVLPV